MIIPVLFVLLFIAFPAKADTTENHACTVKEFQNVAQRDYGVEICDQETGAGWKGKLVHYFEDYKTLKINLRSQNSRSPLLVQRDCVARIEFFVNEKEEYNIYKGINIQNSVTIYLNEDNCNQHPKDLVLKVRIKNFLKPNVKVSCFEASKILYDVPKCELEEKQARAIPSNKTSSSVPLIPGVALSTTSTTTKTTRKPLTKKTARAVNTTDTKGRTGLQDPENHESTTNFIQTKDTSSSQVPLIAGVTCGGLLLVIALIALGVWLFKKRQRVAEAEEMEMNADINDVYGTYGECGEGDYNIVEDTNPNYEAAD